jgi:hypothetical protein
MHKSPERVVTTEPYGVTIPEAGARGLGGPTAVYGLIKDGEVETYTIGKRRFVTTESIRAYIKRRLAAADATKTSESASPMAAAWAARRAKLAAMRVAPPEAAAPTPKKPTPMLKRRRRAKPKSPQMSNALGTEGAQ